MARDSGSDDADILQTSAANLLVDSEGIIVIRFHADCRLAEAASREVVRAHTRLAHGEKRPVLVDARGLKSADREAREVSAGDDVAAVTERLAILVGNPVSRVIGNFFLHVSAPKYPTRVFDDERQARVWLQERP